MSGQEDLLLKVRKSKNILDHFDETSKNNWRHNWPSYT